MDHDGATISLTGPPPEPGEKPVPPTQPFLMLVKFFDKQEYAEGMMDGNSGGEVEVFQEDGGCGQA